MMYHRTCGLVLFLAAASLDLHQPNGTSTPPRDGAKQRVADSTLFREPITEPSTPGGSTAKKGESDQEKQRRKLLGVWQDHYQGKRTMTLNEDGTGTMLVELSGLQATLFASQLRFDMQWSLDGKKMTKKTVSGEPAGKVNFILKTMGDTAVDTLLELTEDRLLLLDQNGKTKYDWKRVKKDEPSKE